MSEKVLKEKMERCWGTAGWTGEVQPCSLAANGSKAEQAWPAELSSGPRKQLRGPVRGFPEAREELSPGPCK